MLKSKPCVLKFSTKKADWESIRGWTLPRLVASPGLLARSPATPLAALGDEARDAASEAERLLKAIEDTAC
ncbi:MAG: hypothetical protein MUF64_00160 [Polyangiaceae bacterium]|nr:hypothetical protein [Polyangiaceae bacterium]